MGLFAPVEPPHTPFPPLARLAIRLTLASTPPPPPLLPLLLPSLPPSLLASLASSHHPGRAVTGQPPPPHSTAPTTTQPPGVGAATSPTFFSLATGPLVVPTHRSGRRDVYRRLSAPPLPPPVETYRSEHAKRMLLCNT